MQLHTINAGSYFEVAEDWRDAFPTLDVRRGYQVESAKHGAMDKHPLDQDGDGDVDWGDIDLYHAGVAPLAHLTRLDERITRAIPRGSPPGLVVMNNESGHPFQRAIETGAFAPLWLALHGAWILQARHSVAAHVGGEGWILSTYGWPRRPWGEVGNMVAAGDQALSVLALSDAITPVVYDPRPGDDGIDTQRLALAMGEARRLSERLGDKPVIPQLAIRHGGDGAFIELGEFERQLDTVESFRGSCHLPGIALWSNATRIEFAMATRDAMVERGYGRTLLERMA